MQEEMHMTQIQFMNTGAREIVPFLDTTFGAARCPMHVFKKVTQTFRWLAQGRGLRRNPRMMHMRKVQYGDVHSTTIFTNKYKQKGI